VARKTKTRFAGVPMGSWMVTFSDMNTLLLTFFVLLFSMSSLTSERFEEAFGNYGGDGLGLMNEGSGSYASSLIFNPMPEIPDNALRTAVRSLEVGEGTERRGWGLPDGVEVSISDAPDGEIEIVLVDRLLFEPGSAELNPEASIFLGRLQNFLSVVFERTTRRITVEGHTDNSAPAEECYITSARRASAVLDFLLADGVLPPERFSIVGYGASRPKVPNDSDANRAQNRRVRIVVEPQEATIFTIGGY